jgi:drug/metabolite transporter (DMT)-like permease
MNQTLPIILNLIAALFGAGGQYLYKLGAGKLGQVPIYKNWEIAVGALLFTGVMGLFIAAFKLGGRLSVTYPVYATTFVWGLLIGGLIEKEPISSGQIAGVGLILAGVALIGIFGLRMN